MEIVIIVFMVYFIAIRLAVGMARSEGDDWP
jgi:hypothetical protein